MIRSFVSATTVLALALALAGGGLACDKTSDTTATKAPGPASSAPTSGAVTPGAAATVAATTAPSAEPAKATGPLPALRVAGFSAPESVLYDATADRYVVSNVNGSPFEADNNGFISDVAPDGKVTNLKWIEGGKDGVTLNAPKGSAIANGVLYVADITTVRMFDAKTGKAKGEVKIAGATFLNDVTAASDGKLYVSDTGVKLEGSDMKPSGSQSLWLIENGKAKTLAKAADLNGPNGVLPDDKGLLVTSMNANEIYRIDDKGKKVDVTKLPTGMLDGVVRAGDHLLVSSWDGSAVYRGKLGDTFVPLLSNQKSPADIGFDSKRSRVLIPHMSEGVLEAYDVK